MEKELQLVLSPRNASHEDLYKPVVARKLRVSAERIRAIRILRRSIDSRGKHVRINLLVRVFVDQDDKGVHPEAPDYKDVSAGKEVVIIGSGPAGLFAALRLIELGWKPVILERGKEVSERKQDIALITKEHRVNPDSNYCFGEGGAGTFSDGKLYTRSKKRGDHRRILTILHWHGAGESILYDAHPHIGSDRLPEIIRHIRETIRNAGGEIHFNTRITGFEIIDGKVTCATTGGGNKIPAQAFILATGHSARDIYLYLDRSRIPLETKPFALGVRVEHPQSLIDSIQYHGEKRDVYLPPATYSLTHQAAGRGTKSWAARPVMQLCCFRRLPKRHSVFRSIHCPYPSRRESS